MRRREREYLEILERRRRHLAERIMKGQLRGASNLNYDRHELGALNWALAIAYAHVDERDAPTKAIA